jgi:hypothetical protein
MAYGAEISRDNPTAFLFVIDQSGSMDDKMESGRSKAQFVSDVLNKTLYTLVTNCTKADGVRKYFDIGVIGYGGDQVASGFQGALSGEIFQSIQAIANSPARIEERIKKVDDGAGGIVEAKTKFPVWFDPKSSGGTPMCKALTRAAEVLADWSDNHPNSYPPTLLHVTDGQSTDGDPESIALAIQQLTTSDGSCLSFNLHVSTAGGGEIIFPSHDSALSDEYSRLLYRMSSPFPSHLFRLAAERGYSVGDGARGFVFNGDPKAIVDFFEIGTRPRLVADR